MNEESQICSDRQMLRTMLLLALVLSFALTALSSAAEAPGAWGNLEPGPYAVGFRVLELYDHSRPYLPKGSAAGRVPGPRARPVQLSVWYPAEAGAGAARLTFGDYVELAGREVDFSATDDAARQRSKERLRTLASPDFVPEIDDEDVTRLLRIPMAATAEIPPAAGRFPLLLWGKGEDGHAVDHALLAEVLASHGYVVASTPALPAHGRRVPRHDAVAVRTQLRDLEFVLHSLHTEPYVDLERLGLLAWSFGGLPAALLQMRHPDVAAIVSFDARTGFRNAPDLFVEAAGYDPSRVSVPLLHLTGSGEPRVDRLKDGSFFDAVRYADVYRLTLAGLRHRDFNFLWGALPELASLEGPWPVPAAEVLERIARITLTFLDATLRDAGDARGRLEQLAASELPTDALSVDFQAGRPAPPTRDDFLWTLETRGVAEAAALFREARAAEPGLELFAADELLRSSRDLLRAQQVDQAEAAARLVIEAHPGSTMGHYMLAQMATSRGQPDDAREHYARCLEVIGGDPGLNAERKELVRRDVEKRLATEGR